MQSKPRKLKPDRSIKVSDRNVANNGNVTILPRPQPERPEPYWHEQLHRGIRYQVPEDTLILDFWAKVRDPDKKSVALVISAPLDPTEHVVRFHAGFSTKGA